MILDPDSDSLRDRIAVWLRGTYEDVVQDATGSTPPEGDWLADADGVLLVLHRYEPPRGDEPRTVLLQVVDGNGHESAAISMTAEHARQLAAELTRWGDRG